MRHPTFIAMLLTLVAIPLLATVRPATTCTAVPENLTPSIVIERMAQATGLSTTRDRVLDFRFRTVRELRDLSDRSYPPYDAAVIDEQLWFDLRTRTERSEIPPRAGRVLWSFLNATSVGDSVGTPAAIELHGLARWQRAFNALAVIADWQASPTVRIEGRCAYRDATRLVLQRPVALGIERLFVNELDGLPVALVRTERSYFMGPERVEYLYYNWEHVGSLTLPLSTMRIIDGARDRLRSIQLGRGGTRLVPPDSAPSFRAADVAAMPNVVSVPPEPFWTNDAPDTVRVGTNTFLLVNAAFTSAVAFAGDTVFVLEGPQGERRAQQDSAWIGRLFPGRHPVVFVVATGIWPHIAGVRYWVANGASVVTHPMTRELVARTLAKRWTAAPDLLERRRSRIRVRIDTVRAEQRRAGGALRVFAVGGVASEGVLAAFVESDGFLWASDRVQDVTNPSVYVMELVTSTSRVDAHPRWTSGPHLRAIPWAALDSLARR